MQDWVDYRPPGCWPITSTTLIILDRDELPDDAAPRPGVPQGKHPHRLLGGGLKALENLFPGFGNELMRAGAEPMEPARYAL